MRIFRRQFLSPFGDSMPVPHPHASVLAIIARKQQGRDPRDITAEMLRQTPGARVDVDNIFTVQAAVLWHRGFAREGISFPRYMVSIPDLPDFTASRRRFPDLNLPTLVDPRLDLEQSCRCADLRFNGDERTFVSWGLRGKESQRERPYWVLAHNGTPSLDRKPSACLAECVEPLFAGTARILIAIHIQHGQQPNDMDGPGSRTFLHDEACAGTTVLKDGNVILTDGRFDTADPACGTVVFVYE